MSLSGKYTTIERVVENLYRDVEYDKINIESVLEWAGEAMDKIGVKTAYKPKVEKVEIKHYRGDAPCDLVLINKTREFTTGVGLRYSTDRFLMSGRSQYHEEGSPDLTVTSRFTYEFDGTHFHTNFEEGTIEVAYKAFPTDERGWPLIPSDTKYLKAVEAYIQYKMDYLLYRHGKLNSNIYLDSEDKWIFAAGQAKSYSLIYDSVDKWESFKNQFVRLMPNVTMHDTNFRTAGDREQRVNNPESYRR